MRIALGNLFASLGVEHGMVSQNFAATGPLTPNSHRSLPGAPDQQQDPPQAVLHRAYYVRESSVPTNFKVGYPGSVKQGAWLWDLAAQHFRNGHFLRSQSAHQWLERAGSILGKRLIKRPFAQLAMALTGGQGLADTLANEAKPA